ncbi:unnamed protein product [Diatraea saccharalis]|uniref:RNMT-activating mini protein n=1 Tax=Diatraea saccharalis TaxID=40085 RepID=A0A9N9N226_9NEOP|nr:unnamed protein product [Diatraea saccharalis]
MTAVDNLSDKDKEFLAECEEQFKDRYTEKDEEFMKVFNAEKSIPPIVKNWWVPQNSGHRNDRRNNRHYNPYEQSGNRNYDRRGRRDYHDNYERRGNFSRTDNYERRGYNDYNRDNDNRPSYNRPYRK